jgi:hypothetical protein
LIEAYTADSCSSPAIGRRYWQAMSERVIGQRDVPYLADQIVQCLSGYRPRIARVGMV